MKKRKIAAFMELIIYLLLTSFTSAKSSFTGWSGKGSVMNIMKNIVFVTSSLAIMHLKVQEMLN